MNQQIFYICSINNIVLTLPKYNNIRQGYIYISKTEVGIKY